MYRPVFRAAAKHGLPVGMHITRESSMQSMTPVGYSSYHIEAMGSWSMYYVSHLNSLIFDGVFEELPDLRVVFVEGGFTWAAPTLWRMDRYWDALKTEIPNVRRRPSEYAREQLRITTQPLEEPENPRHLMRLIELVGGEDMLMFSSDYPHWDYDDPRFVGSRFPAAWRDKVLSGNAIELYGLPKTRPVDALDVNADAMTRYKSKMADETGVQRIKSSVSHNDFIAAD
jgi:predicted TIM-barrel fold metal-dependent hydrolase